MITIRPSKLDILAVCPCFESGEAGAAAQSGTDQHAYAAALLTGKPCDTTSMKSEDKDNVEWYVDYVRATSGDNRQVEIPLELIDEHYTTQMKGTADVICEAELWDYKSDKEEREHKRQMAAYALMVMDRNGKDKVIAHLCYGRLRKVVKLEYTRQEAEDLVQSVLSWVYNPTRKQNPCDYCSWCKLAKECPSLNRWAVVVATNYAPEQSSEIASWHPSEVTDPAQIGRMLTTARIVAAWCDSVEHHAKLLAQQQGILIPGWRLQEKSGARQITDITKAYELSGLSQDQFLQACDVGVSKLEDIYSTAKGLKKAQAKKEINTKLVEVIKTKNGYSSLVKIKEE